MLYLQGNQIQHIMKSLIKASDQRMTSREIAELTGKRHDHVMRDIKVIEDNLNGAIPKFGVSEYKDSTGRSLAMYTLTKKECLLVVSKYSDALRLAIIDRWEELERGNLPATYLDALKALVSTEEARQIAESKLDMLIHNSKSYTSSEIAKELNMKSAIALNNLLSSIKVQYKVNGTWVLYSRYADQGLEDVKQQVLDNGRVIYDRKWTGKGRDFIINILKK